MLNIKYKMSGHETRPCVETSGRRLNIEGTSVQNYISIFENISSTAKHFNEKLSEDLIIPLLAFYNSNRRRERLFFPGFCIFSLIFSYIVEPFQQNSLLQTYSIPHYLNEHLSVQFNIKRSSKAMESYGSLCYNSYVC